jgi:hypothetical protein
MLKKYDEKKMKMNAAGKFSLGTSFSSYFQGNLEEPFFIEN